MNLYVGNLSYDLSESDLNRTFTQYGTVESVRLITDRDTGRPRGFGFVEMSDKAVAWSSTKHDLKLLAKFQITKRPAARPAFFLCLLTSRD